MADYESEKALAAAHAVKAVRDGMLVGLGSGSTASYAIRKLGRCIQAGLRIEAVATSEARAALARYVGLVLVPLDRLHPVHLTIDGIAPIDPHVNSINRLGGALTQQQNDPK